jgi:hypothetical protein
MQSVINNFVTIMSWFVLSMDSVLVVYFAWCALHLQQHKRLALIGSIGMICMVAAAGVSLFLLSMHAPRDGGIVSSLLPLLVVPILTCSVYTLTFPPLSPLPGLRFFRARRPLLLLLTCFALVVSCCLVLLDLLL